MEQNQTTRPTGTQTKLVPQTFREFHTEMFPEGTEDRWTKQQRRAYGRIKSCVEWALHRKEQLYFLTLTASNVSEVTRHREIYNALKKRIRRKYGNFEYIRIRTEEGRNRCVHHILCKCEQRMDISWIREQWEDLFKARQMRIVECYGDLKRLVRYLVGYLTKHPKFRMSWSGKMMFKGWVKTMKELIKYCGFEQGIKEWRNLLSNKRTLFQARLSLEEGTNRLKKLELENWKQYKTHRERVLLSVQARLKTVTLKSSIKEDIENIFERDKIG